MVKNIQMKMMMILMEYLMNENNGGNMELSHSY
jgi:hypothetical protein